MENPTIIQRRKIKVSIQNKPSAPKFSTKLSGPKPFQAPKKYKQMGLETKDADPSCEIQLRKEKVEPKTKFFTIIEMKHNK